MNDYLLCPKALRIVEGSSKAHSRNILKIISGIRQTIKAMREFQNI